VVNNPADERLRLPEEQTASARRAETRVPIHPDIAARWSPRAFDPDAVVTGEQLTALLEAARWAPTWGHRQPVRFVVGLRGDETFAAIAGVLKRGNRYAHAAMANITIEAVSRGLIVHPMAGFDADAARAAFAIPDEVRPLVVVAVGALGDYAKAAQEIVERDLRPRERLPLENVAFTGTWGSAFRPGTSSPAP
jgi:nitroreductase